MLLLVSSILFRAASVKNYEVVYEIKSGNTEAATVRQKK
jgi:hypothetical protein